MKQKDFLIWMLIFPLICSIQELVTEYLIGRSYPIEVHGIAALITMIFYISVGCLLWNKRTPNE